MASAMEPMNDAERRDLLRLIEQRKNDLLEKRKLLETLSGKTQSTFAAPSGKVDVAAASASLLKDVMSAVSSAQPSETTPVFLPKTFSPTPSKEPSTSPAGVQTKYTRALRRVCGPFARQAGAVDITVTPKVVDRFDRSCQCDDMLVEAPALRNQLGEEIGLSETGDEEGVINKDKRRKDPDTVKTMMSYKIGPQEVLQGQKKIADRNQSLIKVEEESLPAIKPQAPPLTEEEKNFLIYSPQFDKFFSRTSRLVERALGESDLFDVFVDYSQLSVSDGPAGSGETIKRLESYNDSRWSRNRPILDIRTNPLFKELFLVSYGQKAEGAINDPDGCALVWNLTMPQRPEYVFSCQSPVCTAMFDPYRPHSILGGTFTGSVVIWDTRSKTRPVQRTPLTTKGHHHPVYSMEVVGTEHAHNLVTVDTDGRLCLWSLSMMSQPTETINLKKSGREVSCLCFGFPEGETNTLIGGAEDGALFQAHIHGSKVGITDVFTGHVAPITSLHWHPTRESHTADFSDLLLSTSFDWTIKLWSPKTRPSPIHSFETANDYVLDAEWHPKHPAIFASCDAEGALNIWDLNKDMELPSVIQSPVGSKAVNKLRWSTDGSRLKTGDAAGNITMWGVSNDVSQPRSEDSTRFASRMEELRAAETRSSGQRGA